MTTWKALEARALVGFMILVHTLVFAVAVPAFGEVIRIGILLPLTGKMAPTGVIEAKAFMMAAEEINDEGGIRGRRVELIIRDTEGAAVSAGKAAAAIAEQTGVSLIAGACSSDAAFAAAAEAERLKIPFLISTAAADEITEQGWTHVFRLSAPSSEHTRTLASFLREIAHVRRVAIFCEDTPQGRYALSKFYKVRKQLGLRVVRKDLYKPQMFDFKHLLLKVKARGPDLIYVISNPEDASLMMRQAREVDLNPTLFAGTEAAFGTPGFLERAKDAAEYTLFPTLWAPTLPYPGAAGFHTRFIERYEDAPGYHGAQAYAAMQVIRDALNRTPSITSEEVRTALSESDIQTVFGPVGFISYGKKARQNRTSALLMEWINGIAECVWPRGLATKAYVCPAPRWQNRLQDAVTSTQD